MWNAFITLYRSASIKTIGSSAKKSLESPHCTPLVELPVMQADVESVDFRCSLVNWLARGYSQLAAISKVNSAGLTVQVWRVTLILSS
jgi:hypothetical protein